nr:Chain C, Gln-ala-glu-val-leu-gln-glu-arg-leu-glu-trp [Equine infectious anemia virus]
QAEVLQERLEW